MKRSMQRHLAILAALGFLLAIPADARASEDEGGCWACAECHPDLWCTGCGVYVSYAISGCCGNGSGQTYCRSEWGGFAVNCNDGSQACQCNTTGENCQSLMMMED